MAEPTHTPKLIQTDNLGDIQRAARDEAQGEEALRQALGKTSEEFNKSKSEGWLSHPEVTALREEMVRTTQLLK